MTKKLCIIALLFSVLFTGLCFSQTTECPALPTPSSPNYFSIVVLPDIQYYTCSEIPLVNTNACVGNRNILQKQIDWIIDNQTAENIRYVAGVGDNVEHAEYSPLWEYEWDVVSYAFIQLEQIAAPIPYGLAVGNHDQIPAGLAYYLCSQPNTTIDYNSLFTASPYLRTHDVGISEFPSCSGYNNNNDNGYDFFTVEGMDFVVLFIEYYRPSEKDVNEPYPGWSLKEYGDPVSNAFTDNFKALLGQMQDVVEQNSCKKVIIVSHYLLNPTLENGKYAFSKQGKYIYEYFKNYSNVFLMLGGHVDYNPLNPLELKRLDGNINTLVSCYHSPRITQTPPLPEIPANSGDGKMRLLRFYPGLNQIQVITFNFHIDANTNPPQPEILCYQNSFTVPSYFYSPGVEITRPQIGNSLTRLALTDIEWTYTDIDSDIKLELFKDGTLLGTIVNNYSPGSNCSGSYEWEVGKYTDSSNVVQYAPAGSGYTILLTTTDSQYSDESGVFTISTIPPGCGTTWQLVYSTGPELFNAITYGNGLYIAVGNDGVIWKSLNGQSWTNVNHGLTTSTLYEVNYYDSKFMAMGASGTLMTSTNGTTWTKTTVAGGTKHIFDFTYGNSIYVAVCNGGAILTSTNGTTWSTYTSGNEPYSLYSVAYGSGKFVVVGKGGKIFTSTNGTQWTQVPGTPTANVLYGITYGNGLFVAVGENGTIITSSDGISWSTPKNIGGVTSRLTDVIYAANLFVVVGFDGKIFTSSDGNAWTSRTSYTPMAFYGVGFGNNGFVAGGNYILDFSNCQ